MAELSDRLVRRYLPDVRLYLVEAARDRRMLHYQELADLVGTNRVYLYQLLDALVRQEHERGRPIISAIVVRRDRGVPGPGFYRIMAELHHTSGEKDLASWRIERERVWAFDWPDER